MDNSFTPEQKRLAQLMANKSPTPAPAVDNSPGLWSSLVNMIQPSTPNVEAAAPKPLDQTATDFFKKMRAQ
jgi:hypothetical protein